jgi:hypothetical protein
MQIEHKNVSYLWLLENMRKYSSSTEKLIRLSIEVDHVIDERVKLGCVCYFTFSSSLLT